MSLQSVEERPVVQVTAPYRRVLAATSLDPEGRRVVARAARLPLAPDARVIVLHAVRPWNAGSRSAATPDARRAVEQLALEGRAAASAAGNPGAGFVPRLARGWPASEIVRAAWEERCELIVVGAPARRFDGSPRGTLARVVRTADLPLLVAKLEPGRRYQRVLCAVDRSVTAVEPVILAGRVSAGAARRLALFHAVRLPFEPWIGSDGGERESEAQGYLRWLAGQVADEVPVTRTWVQLGRDPGAQILRAAAADRADLVVLGARGRSPLTRMLGGSTVEWVLASVPVDVAVARPHRVALERSGQPSGS